jgi:ATP-dependent RNA helicase RhlE
LNNNNFHSLGVGARVCQALEELGYHQPTPIQSRAIPQLLAGKDMLGIAQTGTGKTAAFALPLLELLLADGIRATAKRPRVLILSPTRELAAQIFTEVEKYSRHVPIRSACIFGGVNARPQIRKLAAGIEILVATPGRLLDLASSGYLNLTDIDHLVLDEADRLLDMGFIRDVKKIVGMLPRSRQSLLFSATMPKEVADLAASILRDPVRIDVSPKSVTVQKIDQRFIEVENGSKQRMLEQLLLDDAVTRAIVFTRTKHGANKVAKKLVKSGIAAEAIHGNKSQNARQRALESFKTGKDWVLVATDIAARGIDVEGISHVINFELPHEPESYVHRIGRTARAGASGVAWSLVDPSEKKRLRAVERLTRMQAEIIDVDLPDDPNPPENSETRSVNEHREHREHRGQGRQGADQNGGNRRNRRGGQRRGRRRSAKAA